MGQAESCHSDTIFGHGFKRFQYACVSSSRHFFPSSERTGMEDTNNIYIWCWDARPFPYFPKTAGKWSDADNWNHGHWLKGRVGLVSVAHVIKDLMERQGFTDYDVSEPMGLETGYKLDQSMSARSAIEPLGGLFFFDGIESDGKIVFRHKDRASVYSIPDDDLIISEGGEGASPFELTRGQESELPRSVRMLYIDSAADYRVASVPSRRLTTTSKNVTTISARLSWNRPRQSAWRK